MQLAEGTASRLGSLLGELATDIELVAGIQQPADEAPMWGPLPAQPGRGFILTDGRVVSPQQVAVESEADELFFGGGLGGGKTDLLIGLGLTEHFNSVIFRSQFTQLRGADGLWSRSEALVGLRGQPNRSEFMWRGLPGGRTLQFGGVGTMREALKWKGRPHDMKGFDEITEFSEAVYRFLIAWLRTSRLGARVRVVATGNPPITEEGQWVIRYWAPWLDPHHPNPAKPGELRWFIVDEAGKDREVPGPAHGPGRAPAVKVGEKWVRPRSRTFIPSSVEDNPYYMRTGYADVLDALPEELQRMRAGDFAAASPDHQWQVIPTAWVMAAQARWTADGGDTEPLSAVGVDPSRGGQDEFVIAPRHGSWVGPLDAHSAKEAPDGPSGAAMVFRVARGDLAVPVHVDSGGIGAATYDALNALKMHAVALNGAEKSFERDRTGRYGFVNRRAEWHWRMREALSPDSGQDLALPPDPQLRADLCAPRWTLTPRGIQVEPKERVKYRIGRSPDRGEAVIYACAIVDTTIPLEFVDYTGWSSAELTPDQQAARAAALDEKGRRTVDEAIQHDGVYWPGGNGGGWLR